MDQGQYVERFGVIAVKTKRQVIHKFSQMPLKHEMSRYLLESLAEDNELLENIVFVSNRSMLPNSMLIAEMGSHQNGFELELGAKQYEEVSIINGRLVRHVKRTRRLRSTDPLEALEALADFSGKLYVMFAFAGETPDWYEAVVEPNPAEAIEAKEQVASDFESLIQEVEDEQLDIALWCILLRHRIEEALAKRDREDFLKATRLWKQMQERCLWEFD